jgi:hypothetical protein
MHSTTTRSIIGKAEDGQKLINCRPDDLFERVQWQLEWKINRGNCSFPVDNCNMVLILSCIPKPEFAMKMDNVWVSIGFTLYSGDPSNGTVIHDVPSNGV